MKLQIDKGQLPLPLDFSLLITRTSPFFSTAGEQSLPVSIPATTKAMELLGFPLRLASNKTPLRQCAAVLSSGAFQRSGQLIFDSYSDDEISTALVLSESDLYSQYSETSIRALFATYIRNDYSSAEDPIDSWAQHIWECSAGTRNDDFIAFPLFADKDEATYFILNEPDLTSDSTPWKYIYHARDVDGGETLVPKGYGITPLLYLHKFIDLLFGQMGYSVRSNVLSSTSFLQKIVLLNHNVDTICKGVINYSDIVPSCTVSEFLEFLEKQFHVSVFVQAESKDVDIISMEDILNNSFDLDISDKVDGKTKLSVEESSRVVLDMDTSLEGAAPAADSLLDFAAKYTICNSLNESEFRDNQLYSIIFRESTGEYYLNMHNLATDECKLERLGSNYFKYDRKNSSASEEQKSNAVAVVMTIYRPSLARKNVYAAPYIGNRSHRNTSHHADNESSEQNIMMCFDAGIASTDEFHSAKYRLGTTQKYNNLGVLWGEMNLIPEDLYRRFWRKYNEILLNSPTSFGAKVNYSTAELMKLNMAKLKCYKGTRLLPKETGYSAGKTIECRESDFLVISNRRAVITDSSFYFKKQYFRWVFHSELADAIKVYEDEGYDCEYEWLDDYNQDSFIYISPPEANGLVDFSIKRQVRITGRKFFSSFKREKPIACWYESEPI